jgi:2-desacetyl-2-hydroxyethyl bacteriochlorophyllide A dehydrogenase
MTKREVIVTDANTVVLAENPLDAGVGATSVLIETEYTYISAGTELAIFTGMEPQTRMEGTWCRYPFRAGYANVGRVLQVGSGVGWVKEGDRVFSFGKHASHVVIDTSDENALVVQVPDSLVGPVAAASRMAGVAYAAPHLAERSIDRWVVVYGLGAVGNLAAQMFGILGCRVIGIDPSAHRRDLAQRCGIAHVVGGSSEYTIAQIKILTGGDMARTAVDAVGDSRVIMQCLRSVARNSEVIILGTPRVAVEGDLTEAFRLSHSNWITIKGALEWMMETYPGTWRGTTLFDKQAIIFDWIARGVLKVEPLISHIVSPDKIDEAYNGLLRDKETYTGVVLDWTKL